MLKKLSLPYKTKGLSRLLVPILDRCSLQSRKLIIYFYRALYSMVFPTKIV